MSKDLSVQDVQDGGVVKGPDPDKIVLEYKAIVENEDGTFVEKVVKNEWVFTGPRVDVGDDWKEEEVSGTIEIDPAKLSNFVLATSGPLEVVPGSVDVKIGPP